jgi:hypothetical protein
MHSSTTRIFRPALIIAAAAAIIQPMQAQQGPAPQIRATTHYTVKSDRAGDLGAAIKEYNAILKKGLWDNSYTIWRSATGPTEMIRVDYFQKWADLDKPVAQDPKLKEYQADLARIVARINESFAGSRRVVDIVNQDVSLPRTTPPPKMIMVWTAHVKQDRMREAIDMERNEYAPAVKSAGMKTYVFAIARYGAPANEIRSTIGLDGWGDLDQANPIRKAMGDEKFRGFSEKMNSLLEDYGYEIYRYDPELSYTAVK